jgi:DNA-binding CsgD family transcriptional regulator
MINQAVSNIGVNCFRANFYSKDAQGRYIYVNQTQLECAQLAAGHPISVDDILDRNDRELPWQALHAANLIQNDGFILNTGKNQTFVETGPVDGRAGYYRSFKSPLLGRSGKIVGVQGISIPLDARCLIPLSKQQMACLKGLALGNTHKQIAHELGLSPKTVEHYLNTVKQKLNCESRSDLILQAIERGLVGVF